MALKQVTYKGKTYQEKQLNPQHMSEDACDSCAFHSEEGCTEGSMPCIPEMRPDSLNVYYVEVQDAQ